MHDPRSGTAIMQDFARFGLQAFYWDQDEFGLHAHEFIEIVYVMRGSASHHYLGRTYPIIAGDFFVINAHTAHGYSGIQGLRIVNMLVEQRLLRGFFPLLRKIRGFAVLFPQEPDFHAGPSARYKLHLPLDARASLETTVDRLVQESAGESEGREAISVALLMQIIATVCRTLSSQNASIMQPAVPRGEPAVCRAVEYLESHFEKELSVDEVAGFACLSPSRLRCVFKKQIGMSPMDYLSHCRLDRAREMLRRENKSISAVALAVGFQDPSYFSRAYRKLFGTTPRQDAAARN